MPLSFLIDTSIFYRLLNFVEEDRNLHKLSVWIKQGEIQVYSPEVLLEGWEDKKKRQLGEVAAKVYKLQKQMKVKRSFSYFDVAFDPVDIRRLKGQFEINDRLVVNTIGECVDRMN